MKGRIYHLQSARCSLSSQLNRESHSVKEYNNLLYHMINPVNSLGWTIIPELRGPAFECYRQKIGLIFSKQCVLVFLMDQDS